MQAAKVSKSILVCALLPWSVLAGRTDQYTFRTIDYPGADFTAGFTISPTGDIGGLTCIGASCQGFLLRHDTEFVLITPPGAAGSFVTGIQRGGFLVAGQYTDSVGTAHGYVWNLLRPTEFTRVDPDGATFTEVADMNPAADLAGRYTDSAGMTHGFVDVKGDITPFDIPGAMSTAAFGVSPAGDLVGTYCDNVGCHAYLLNGGIEGALTTIDAPGAVSTDAFGINARGQIVGDYCRTDGTCHGYVREPDGAFVTVDPPGSTFSVAFAIDPAGEITGLFCDASGACHAFAAIATYSSATLTSVAPRGAGASALLSRKPDHRGKGALALSLAQR